MDEHDVAERDGHEHRPHGGRRDECRRVHHRLARPPVGEHARNRRNDQSADQRHRYDESGESGRISGAQQDERKKERGRAGAETVDGTRRPEKQKIPYTERG
ncbi:hypothetical protein Sfulv_01290 [Streptomyces fulvorobeus]|uniref:Uncharacterized protein n=1 Tax=Streptomyces fulvorobeus TaxID=284028 RepID=A0A7J0BYL2_9ACTN|nr:hypothetical protein Sfulv_01290 [Streptomyces fulvorobeus]